MNSKILKTHIKKTKESRKSCSLYLLLSLLLFNNLTWADTLKPLLGIQPIENKLSISDRTPLPRGLPEKNRKLYNTLSDQQKKQIDNVFRTSSKLEIKSPPQNIIRYISPDN